MSSLRQRWPKIRPAACLLVAVMTLPAAAEPMACGGFMTSMTQSLPDQHVQFEHPLLVSRSAPAFGVQVYDLVTTGRVDGTLHCRRDHLVRFEAKISLPADPQVQRGFDKVQQTAITAALKWPAARATTTLREMSNEAAEYLRASIERGDVYLAGKTESHQNGTDLGMLWTKTDRTFIISRPE